MKNTIEQLKELKDNLDSKVRECDKLRKSYESQGEYLTARNYSLMRGAFEYGLEGVEKILNERNSVDEGEIKTQHTCYASIKSKGRCVICGTITEKLVF